MKRKIKNILVEYTECRIKPGRCCKPALPGITMIQEPGRLRRKLLVFILLLTAVISTSVFAQSQPTPSKSEKEILIPDGGKKQESVIANPENFLGLNPSEIFEIIGAPESVYPMRGKLEWQDDVIFYYSSNLYLFFFDNRVWQIRGDYRFEGNLLGIRTGMDREKTRNLLGKPAREEKDEDIYLNPAKMTRLEKGFPVRMRLIFDLENKLADIYLYRGDY